MFKLQQQVRVINVDKFDDMDGKPEGLKLGKIYPIEQIHNDKKGNQHLDVGLRTTKNYVRSRETQEELPMNKSYNTEGKQEIFITQWCHPSRFELVTLEEQVNNN